MEESITKDTGLPAKCLLMIPERVALGMVDDGWILRNKIIWAKPNHMPSSVRDRLSNGWEVVYFFVKSRRYWFDLDAIRAPHEGADKSKAWWSAKIDKASGPMDRGGESQWERNGEMWEQNPAGKNPGDVWKITTQPFPDAHFATFPEALVERPIKASCPAEICAKCGKARERIVKATYLKNRPSAGNDPRSRDEDREAEAREYFGSQGWRGNNLLRQTETLGWTVCSCPEPRTYRPGIVLDPFAGSGTIAKVAKENQRSSISIEIKPDYVRMLKERIDFGHETVDNAITWLTMRPKP